MTVSSCDDRFASAAPPFCARIWRTTRNPSTTATNVRASTPRLPRTLRPRRSVAGRGRIGRGYGVGLEGLRGRYACLDEGHRTSERGDDDLVGLGVAHLDAERVGPRPDELGERGNGRQAS